MSRDRVAAGVVVVALGLLAGCSAGEVQISKSAVGQVGRTVDNTSVTVIELSGDDVGRLAGQANVEDDVIRKVAPELDNQASWQNWLVAAGTIYEETPGEVRSGLISIACDGVNGGIRTEEELWAAIEQEFIAYAEPQQVAFRDAAEQLWQDLYDARTSDDPNLRAAAVLTCATVEQLVGLD